MSEEFDPTTFLPLHRDPPPEGLRDEIAKTAMAALIRTTAALDMRQFGAPDQWMAGICSGAYAFADEMLRARVKS